MIRPAKVDDITGIIELGKELLDESPVLPPHDPLKARKALAFFISGARTSVFVAEHDGEIVGFIVGVLDEYWWSEVQYASDAAFYVKPEFRGYAVGLVKRLVTWAKKFKKVKHISLGVSSGLETYERTGQLYERLGFKPVGGIHTKSIEVDQ